MAARYMLARAQSGRRDVSFPGRACLLLSRTVYVRVADARNAPANKPNRGSLSISKFEKLRQISWMSRK